MEGKTHRKIVKQKPNLKMPSRGKTTSNQIERRLKNASPWYNSIEHPKQGADCKIPDETGEETGTIQCVTRISQTVGGSGLAGVRVITPYVNTCNVNPSGTAVGCNYQILDPNQTPTGDMAFGHITSGSIFQAGGGYPLDTNETLQTNAQSVRVVSASLSVISEASDIQNEGEALTYSYPFDTYTKEAIGTGLNGTTLSAYKKCYGSGYVPLNTKKGMMARWFPYATAPLDFKEFVRPIYSTIGSGNAQCPNWEMGAIISGASVGTSIEFEIVVNYEFLPVSNAINLVQAKPSPNDVKETELVLNWIQDEPMSRPISEAHISAAPKTVQPSHEDVARETGGWGFDMKVLEELAPIALGLLSLL